MRRTTICAAIVAAVLALAVAPVFAKKPAGPAKPATVGETTHGPQTTSARATTPKPKSTPKSQTKTTTKSKTTPTNSTKASAPTTSGTTAGDTGGTTNQQQWTNVVSRKLATKSNLMSKVQKALGISTTAEINGATSWFKNFGQFVAAVNASQNHPNIAFADIKALMTGFDMHGQRVPSQTGTLSLGQALKKLGMDESTATAAATRATTQADAEINAPSSTTTSVSTKIKPKSKKKNTAATTTPTGESV